MLIYSDSGPNSPSEEAAIRDWIEKGGVLLRFAGPHLAEHGDKLLPVRLRRGGRTMGGALSWDQPARLAPFAPESPFAGLTLPADVTVTRQVLAEPDIELANKTWARLVDGTPLVTAEKIGKGWTVLVHTTANTEWSNLAISGLFVEMLRRVVGMSQGVTAVTGDALPPLETLDGFGRLQPPPPSARPVSGAEIATAMPSPRHPPGFYGVADSRRALNLSGAVTELKPIGDAARRGRPRPLRPEKRGGRFAPAAADRRLPAGADRPGHRLCVARPVAPPRRAGRDSREPAGRDALDRGPARKRTTRLSCAPPPSCAWPMCAPAIARSTRSAAPG